MRILILKSLFLLLLTSCSNYCNGVPHSTTSYNRRSDAFDFTGGHSTSILPSFLRSKKALCLGAVAWYTSTCLQVVTSGDECLVERFGRYHRKLGPGWHLVIKPFETGERIL